MRDVFQVNLQHAGCLPGQPTRNLPYQGCIERYINICGGKENLEPFLKTEVTSTVRYLHQIFILRQQTNGGSLMNFDSLIRNVLLIESGCL